MECPYINRSLTPDRFNVSINYRDLGGTEDYVFYDHDDGFGKITRVQFCKLIGRKRDVFQCLNESEWRNCSYFFMEKELSLREEKKEADDEHPEWNTYIRYAANAHGS